MGKYRIYSNKSNTIASSPAYEIFNSSQNVHANLWYGGGAVVQNTYRYNSISRHLILFDLTEFISKLKTFEINPQHVLSYRLKMTNSTPPSNAMAPEYEKSTLEKKIAQSFDLVAFPINKEWDEGRGIDLIESSYLIKQPGSLNLTGYSNWLSATTLTSWDEPGIFSNPTASTSDYAIQHFEHGSEDMDMDITNMVLNWISGGTNYGLCIGYTRPYELSSGVTRYTSSFYTNITNSAFKPYIEVEYDQVIRDDRNQVGNNRPSKLFLYLYSGNTPTDYFSASTVDIKTAAGATVYSGLTPIHHSKGVYYVNVWMSGTTKGQRFKDVWSGITFDPLYDQQNITQQFEIRDNYYYTNNRDVNQYVVSNYGLPNNSTLHRGEKVRIYIDTRINYSQNRPLVGFGLQYRLSMNTNIELIPWTDTNSVIIDGSLKSYIDIDTTWLLNNQTYEIALKVNDIGTSKVLSNHIFFSVVDPFYPVRR